MTYVPFEFDGTIVLGGIQPWMDYDPITNRVRSLSEPAPKCIHGGDPGFGPPGPCLNCWMKRPMVDVDLGSDL